MTPIEAAADAAVHGHHAAQPRHTTMEAVHRDAAAAWHGLGRMLPVLEAIATDPLLRQLAAEGLEAAHMGGLEPVIQAAIDMLAKARERQQATPGTGPQPAFPPGQPAFIRGCTPEAPASAHLPDAAGCAAAETVREHAQHTAQDGHA